MTTGLPVFNAQGGAHSYGARALRYPIGSIAMGSSSMSSNSGYWGRGGDTLVTPARLANQRQSGHRRPVFL